MSRDHNIKSVTVTKTGTVYEVADVPKELKDVSVLIEVSQEGTVIGTYEAHGWVEDGDIVYVVPGDLGAQLEASQARTATKAPSDTDKAEVNKRIKE